MDKLEIVVKIIDEKCLKLGKPVVIFGRKKIPVGFDSGDSIVFATEKPKTMTEAKVYSYTISELKHFYGEGNLQGLIDYEQEIRF